MPAKGAESNRKGAVAALPGGDQGGFPAAWQAGFLAAILGAAQQRRLVDCDQRFLLAADQYRSVVQTARKDVASARMASEILVLDCVDDLQCNGESVIRLLSEGVGERATMHPINVVVLSLLLGRAQGLSVPELQELGVAALLHDLGKLQLPAQLSQPAAHKTGAEWIGYHDHVG